MLKIIHDRILLSHDELIFKLLKNERILVTFLNPHSYLFAKKTISREVLENFFIGIDGISLSAILSMVFVRKVGRLSFDYTSLSPVVFNHIKNNNKSIYIIGSNDDSINKFCNHIIQEYSGINMIGFRGGYFRDATDRMETINYLLKKNPDFIVSGMGTPNQEEFLHDCRNAGWNGVGFTCGGFIHQTAKHGKEYYPIFINRFNLRWLYRIYDEPRLLKRYLVNYPFFLFIFILDLYRYFFKIKNK